VELETTVGDRTVAGESVIGRWPSPSASRHARAS
jgi:hypothetical protein